MSQIFIQISDKVIRDPNINAIEFVILARLKYLSFTNRSDELEIDSSKLKYFISISDNRTLKKSFENLHKQGYIKNEVEFKQRKPIQVQLDGKILNEKPFTQLPSTLQNKLSEIEHLGYRLIYYYESYITRGSSKGQFCYCSIETIRKHIGAAKNSILKYNEKLIRLNYIEVQRHKLSTEYNYNDNDEIIFDKYNNHYYINIEKFM